MDGLFPIEINEGFHDSSDHFSEDELDAVCVLM